MLNSAGAIYHSLILLVLGLGFQPLFQLGEFVQSDELFLVEHLEGQRQVSVEMREYISIVPRTCSTDCTSGM